MPTISELTASEDLVRFRARLDPGEMDQRLIYCVPRVITWMKETLPTLESDGFFEDAATPLQQVDSHLRSFIVGDRPLNGMPPKSLQPHNKGIWELRTFDLRFFGWFFRVSCFVISDIATKKDCSKGLYNGYVRQAIHTRNELAMKPEPEFTTGGIDDLLST